jgi:molybdopterin molybdotransferase
VAVADLLAWEDALATVLSSARPLPAESVRLEQATGRILAETAVARVDLPSFASSAMDGYAVRSGDVPGRLPVVDRSAAGRPAARSLARGEAIAVATGAVVPVGADAVVPIEYVVEHDNEVEIPGHADSGAHIRRPGGDLEAGQAVAQAGTRLGAAQVGALAAAGVAEVACARRPRVAVLSTGTELRPPGAELGHGQIYEANAFLLAAAAASAGGVPERLAPVADEEEAHREAIAHGLEADVLITSGGVSVGPHDVVRRVGRELGVEESFWRVAVKPGKPVAFGTTAAGTLVFGLPGNPVSALVGFELFVRPALLALQGAREPGPRFLPGRLARGFRPDALRDTLVRSRAHAREDHVALEPVTGQESHMIARAAVANALVHVPRGEGELDPGTAVRYIPLD